MRSIGFFVLCSFVLILVLSSTGWSSQVMGKVTSVSGKTITASFPVPVKTKAVISVLSGADWWSLAGTAMVKSFAGNGPYEVTGKIISISDLSNLAVGKRVYVETSDTVKVPDYYDGPRRQVMGKVTSISGETITVSFPVPVKPKAVMSVLSGKDWWSLAGTALAESFAGDGPYEVTGTILSINDLSSLALGKRVYVEASDTVKIPK